MKTIASLVLALGMLVANGCAHYGPYSEGERWSMVARGIAFDSVQLRDDIDSALLLRPGSMMSVWNIHTQ